MMRLRWTFILLAGTAMVLVLAGRPAPPSAWAEGPRKENANDARLRQTVQKLQAELAERNQKIQRLQTQLNRVRKGPDPDDATIRRLQQQLRDKDRRINELEDQVKARNGPDSKKDTRELENLRKSVKDLEAIKQARYVHALILRLKKGSPERDVTALLANAPKTLGRIPGVRAVWVGKPASVASESARTDFQVGVVVLFDDDAAMKRFLDDASQKRFFEGLSRSWEAPTIYDFLP